MSAREHPPYGIAVEFLVYHEIEWRIGRTAHLCNMSDDGLHEVVFLVYENGAPRVFFFKDVKDWKFA